MSLIDKTYFVFEINIPDSEFDDLDAYITRYEKEILQKVLGYALWKLVSAYTTGSDQRIKDIVEGKEYTNSDGDLIKWNGLKNEDKISFIAYYVYYWYSRNKSSMLGQLGQIKPKTESSSPASPAMSLSQSWLRMKTLAGSARQDLNMPSLYNFLTENESDYPEWVFEELGSVNAFDL